MIAGRRHEGMRSYLEGLFGKWLAVDRTGEQDATPSKAERDLGARAARIAMRELEPPPQELTLDV